MTDEWLEDIATERPDPPRQIDTSVAHIARVYDYWLGGKDNFAPDRAAGEAARAEAPHVVEGVRGNRAFLARAVRYLASEAGIRQFLDIGTGIPAANNTHEVAQAVAPECRVVYVDNDPVVLAHARALLTSGAYGRTSYLDADLRDVPEILRAAADTLDFSQPVAVMLIGVLHCIPDDADPAGLVATLMAAVPPGSYLAISHPASDIDTEGIRNFASRLAELMPARLRFRTRPEVERFFNGLELVQPGLVRIPEWRPGLRGGGGQPGDRVGRRSPQELSRPCRSGAGYPAASARSAAGPGLMVPPEPPAARAPRTPAGWRGSRRG